MAVAMFTGHAPVRNHLVNMGLFEGDSIFRFCRKGTETEPHIICCCEALVGQRYIVLGNLFLETKDIRTASVMDLCPFIRGSGFVESELNEHLGMHNKPKSEVPTGH
jgi:hypothetical protein